MATSFRHAFQEAEQLPRTLAQAFKRATVIAQPANVMSTPSESNTRHSLFHPRFVEVRSDKYEADTLESVKAQF